MQKIGLAADHAGFELKEKIKLFLKEKNISSLDLGTNSSAAVDYSDYGKLLATNIQSGAVEFGVAICGTGIGISIAANRITGVRAALCCNTEMAKLSRNHNNANIIAFGARMISYEEALGCLKVFLEEKFDQGRHSERVEKLG